jgi:hypothetical protein
MFIRSPREHCSSLARLRREPMKDCFLHDAAALQVLDDDSLEQLRSHCAIPDSFRIHDDDWSSLAHAQAWSLAPLHASRSEQQSLSLEQRGEQRVERATSTLRRAVTSRADDDVPRVRFHRPW